MSGGSFNYLYQALGEGSRSGAPGMIHEMLKELEPGSPEHEATKRIIDMFSQITKEAEALYGVWKTIEYVRSGDWGDERIAEAIEKYRSLVSEARQ